MTNEAWLTGPLGGFLEGVGVAKTKRRDCRERPGEQLGESNKMT